MRDGKKGPRRIFPSPASWKFSRRIFPSPGRFSRRFFPPPARRAPLHRGPFIPRSETDLSIFWGLEIFAETDLVEQLAAASERVFDAKLTPEAVRQRLLPSVRQSRGGDWTLKAKLPAHARFWNAGGTFADRPALG